MKQVADILPRSPVLEIIVQALRICICRQFSFNIDTDGPGTILYPMNVKIGIIMTLKDVLVVLTVHCNYVVLAILRK